MKSLVTLAVLLILPACFAGAAFAQEESSATRKISSGQLEQLLAPVALYPDMLLSQLLQGATYPVDLAEAVRWSRDNPSLRGEAAVMAVLSRPWDASVKTLAAFPALLETLDGASDWTQRLGQAFLAAEENVLETIQKLRRKAYAAGQLRSGEQLRVDRQGGDLIIDPASAYSVHLPDYDPARAYGDQQWTSHPPSRWAPWAGYTRRPGESFAWGPPVPLSRNLVYGGFDWKDRRTHIASIRFEARVAIAAVRKDDIAPARDASQGAEQAVLRNIEVAMKVASSAPLVPPASARERANAELDAMAVEPAPPAASGREPEPARSQPEPARSQTNPASARPDRAAKPAETGKPVESVEDNELIRLMPKALDGLPAEAPRGVDRASVPPSERVVEPRTPTAAAAAAPAALRPVLRAFASAADRRTLDGLAITAGRERRAFRP